MSRAARVLLAACLGGHLIAACTPASERPSLLLLTVDTLRADAVSAWGGRPGLTPVIDELCARGTRFAQASSVTPLTLPAHASMLTGLRPARHGLTVNGVALPRLPVPTLAERLHEGGWSTAAFVSSMVLDHRHGLAVGFDAYDDDLLVPGGPPVPTERRGDDTVDRALAWNGWSADPFFAWVHLFDPHAPYAAPVAAADAAADAATDSTTDSQPTGRSAYEAEVAFVDAQLGRLLDVVRARARGPVLVILAADHGEGLGEHGEETHGLLLHEATMHVPLAVAWLGVPPAGARFPVPGSVRSDPVSVLDVLPTVLDVLGLADAAGASSLALDGRSLRTPEPGRALPLETRAPWVYYGFSPLVGVRRDGEKLVGAPLAGPPLAESPGWTLTHPAADPREGQGTVVQEHALLALLRSPEPDRQAAPVGDGDALAALGYMGRQAPDTPSAAALADPRAEQAFIVLLDRANTELVIGHAEAALAMLDAEGLAHAMQPELLLLRGKALGASGRWDEAVEVLQRAQKARPTADLAIELGRALLMRAQAAGVRPDAAIPALDAALAAAPGEPRAIALRALADLLSGEPAAALVRLDAALTERPRDITLLSVKLQALVALRRDAEAESLRALLGSLWPEHPALAAPAR